MSPDANTRPILRPYAQGTLTYLVEPATLELNASLAPTPNPLTAQLIDGAQVTVRASTPISLEHAILASSTLGYLHGSTVSLRRDQVAAPDFDTIVADAQISWLPTATVELFARYQFLNQLASAGGIAGGPGATRNAAILGIQISSRPDTTRVRTTLSQRVDRSDVQPAETEEASP